MLKTMRKVLNVHSFIFLFICLLTIGCYSSKKIMEISDYSIKKFKSSRKSITINTFDKGFPYDTIRNPLITINNLYFGNTNFFRPKKGIHNIEIDFIGKIPIKIKDLVVKEGDSIVINAYLKDDPTPISD